MIEEFVKLMDSSIEKKIIGKDYLELIPIGSYSFNIFNEEDIKDIITYYELTGENLKS